VASAEKTGDYGLKIKLSQPYFMNDYVLGGISPIPRHYYDPENLLGDVSVSDLNHYESLPADKKERADRFAKAFNENFNRNPLGPGALVLENPGRDFITGEKVELRRRASWAAGHPELGDPWTERLIFKVMTDYD